MRQFPARLYAGTLPSQPTTRAYRKAAHHRGPARCRQRCGSSDRRHLSPSLPRRAQRHGDGPGGLRGADESGGGNDPVDELVGNVVDTEDDQDGHDDTDDEA